MPKDEHWVTDPEQQDTQVQRAKDLVGARMCATCYARDVAQEQYREDNGDERGRHWTFEEPSGDDGGAGDDDEGTA